MDNAGFLINFDKDDAEAQDLIRQFENATQGERVRVQIGFLLKSNPGVSLREPVLETCTEGAAYLVALAERLKSAYQVVSILAETANDAVRAVVVSVSDVLLINILTTPVEPEPQDEQRRSKLRGHGN